MGKKPITHVLMTVDDSGSMRQVLHATRSGFNEYVQSLRADADAKYRLTVVKFGRDYELLTRDAKLREVPALDDSNYRAMQLSTSLYDAIGRMIGDFERVTALGPDDKVLLVVQTDGLDNSSREFTVEKIRDMIAEREAKGWQCIFLGAGPDAWAQGHALGFAPGSVLRTTQTGPGTAATYSGLAAATTGYSRGATRAETVALIQGELEKENSKA